MTHVLTINNRDYIPAGQVGKHFGYTRDYILTLTREGKIDGQKIGHRWYVNLASAEAFFSTAKIIREERKKIIREERRQELKASGAKRFVAEKRSMLVESLAVAAIVFVLTVAGYVGTESSRRHLALLGADTTFFKELALSFYNFISNEDVAIETTYYTETPLNDPAFREESIPASASAHEERATRTVHTSLVVGPDEVMSTTSIESIRDSFSDEVSVSVDPHNPDAGIIIPHFKNGDGDAYRYLMVPIDEAADS